MWSVSRAQFESELDELGSFRHAGGVYRRLGEPSPPWGAKCPRVNFFDRDLLDGPGGVSEASLLATYASAPSDVYAAYVSADDVPNPVLAEESAASELMAECAERQRRLGWPSPGDEGYENCDDEYVGSYDWDSLRAAKVTPPPKIRVRRDGSVELIDGNHRVAMWLDRGFTHVPAWVIDERGHRPSVASAVARGRSPYAVAAADYPELFPARRNPGPTGGRVSISAEESSGDLFVEARHADGGFVGRVRVSLSDHYDEARCGRPLAAAARRSGVSLWLATVSGAWVATGLRGRGVGTRLYVRAMREAFARGAALAPDTCAWSTTSPEARRVWDGRRFRKAAEVVGEWPYVVAFPKGKGGGVKAPRPRAARRSSG